MKKQLIVISSEMLDNEEINKLIEKFELALKTEKLPIFVLPPKTTMSVVEIEIQDPVVPSEGTDGGN